MSDMITSAANRGRVSGQFCFRSLRMNGKTNCQSLEMDAFHFQNHEFHIPIRMFIF